MKEVELRILDIDREKLINKISSIGGTFIGEYQILDIYYDIEGGLLKETGKKLRLRKMNDDVYFTFKSKRDGHSTEFNSRQEFEVRVDDLDTTEKILFGLGYEVSYKRIKRRISYSINPKVRIEFDKYLGNLQYIPEFAELEGANEEDVMAAVDLLGYKMSDTINWGAKKIVRYYDNLKMAS